MDVAATLDPSNLDGAHEYIVTAMAPSKDSAALPLWSHIWNSNRPMSIGFPFQWVLEKTDKGIRIRRMGGALNDIISEPVKEVPFAELANNEPILLPSGSHPSYQGDLTIRIQPVAKLQQLLDTTSPTSWRPNVIPVNARRGDERAYRRILTAVAILSFLFLMKVSLTPNPPMESQELIPAQYAKVILQSKPKTQLATKKPQGSSPKTNNNVVQAFKSTAVQKTTRALFNSGAATALLSKSKLLDSAGSKTQLNQVFGTSSRITGGLRQIEGNTLDPKSKKIGLMGGAGGKGGVGYSTGAGGTIAGQGTGMVTFTGRGLANEEGLTRDEVGRVIREHLKEVRYCYESAIQRNPGLEGKVLVNFTIRSNGRVSRAIPAQSSGDKGLDNCITSHLMKWAFPKPRGGADVGVSYPFIFKTLTN